MAIISTMQKLLNSAHIVPEIFELRSDYRALLMVIEAIPQSPSDDASETLLCEAENSHEAYKAFGAKPQKTRNSLEALTRRAEGDLPRVNRLTDIYNAISVKHQVPIGGEDLDKYNGSPFLTRASRQDECAVPGEPICRGCGLWRGGQAMEGDSSGHTTDILAHSFSLSILYRLPPFSDYLTGSVSCQHQWTFALVGLQPKRNKQQRERRRKKHVKDT
ncbi:Phenylalanyl-tRNA synthetase [Trichoderma pleuroticola]